VALERVGFVAVPPGREPGFDHADFFHAGKRIYVAHTGADGVDVIDCEGGRFLHALPDLPGVAGVLIDQEDDLLFTSDRGCARVSVFRCSDEELLGQVPVGPHPNGLAYDAGRLRLHAFNLGDPPGEACTVSAVDIASMSVIAELDLPGRPRWALHDRERDVVYANIREPAEIVVIDAERLTIVGSLSVPAAGPHGLWLDHGRLFCAADGGALAVLDADDGRVLARHPLAGVPDVIMHDAVLHRLYVAVGDPGVVCCFDSDTFEAVETVSTEAGAHTLGLDPVAHRLYVFCPESSGAAVYAES
jgi:DNA-binding beta-propeller fold protein YncE